MNLVDVYSQFQTDEQCMEYWEKVRWPNGPRCPNCDSTNVSPITRQSKTKNKRGRIFTCLNTALCGHQFSATSGTIFHDSHLPLRKWFMAIALIVDAKKGMSAKQLQRHLKVSYQTAWHLAHRIRKAMEEDDGSFLGNATTPVEVDETWVGGKTKLLGRPKTVQFDNKDMVVGMKERGGRVRMFHTADRNHLTLRGLAEKNISPDVPAIMTDEWRGYGRAFFPTKFWTRHETVNHSKKEYVRGDIHTMGIESAFSLFKRGIVGSFHKVSVKHLHRYLREFEFRFNRRQQQGEIFGETLQRIAINKPLPYQELIAENKAR